ncbi:hypothetical protein GXW78_14540 [Roseomonas terrae]|jgi:hypothetical protein|uniref:Uncharacterized protein n=1 Tax=Neoroseomonas terrae TaxID=424799 RepID=A0ABS5EIR0_9PROT|nr:hypothetical protein [Neoroseomonas terrae]MBR0650888.1 hypothetical protein [Neoroseomonas terrae]
MTTTLQINLTQDMQTWLGSGNGVYAYAVLYGSDVAGGAADTPLGWQTMVSDGAVQSGGSFTLDLTKGDQPNLYGGKVYFIIQSVDDTADAIDPSTLAQSSITWANAAALDYRYDSIEVSLTGAAGDAANLTSIEGFGIGMALEASTGSRSYAVSAGTLFTDLAAAPTDTVAGSQPVTTFTQGGLAGQNREAVSPAVAVDPHNDYAFYRADDWTRYIDALKAPDTPIIINGYFNGAGDLQAGAASGTPVIWRNAGFFSYRLDWDEHENTFWLTPTEGSQIQGAIKLTAGQLADSIYSTLGTVELYDTPHAATPFELYPGTSEMNVGANNAWGQVLQQLTLGLTAGYLQSSGILPNTEITGGIDFNKNYNWSPDYAYGNNTDSHLGSDVTVRWDPYSEIFYRYSNSYGTQYADALMTGFAQGGPQLSTYANGQNVSTMTVTLFADTETPTAGLYTPPLIYNYVAPGLETEVYEVAQWYEGNGSNITLNFNPGDSLAQSLVLRDDVAISIRILTGYDGTTPQWQDIRLGGNGQSPWQNWTFAHDGTTYSVSGGGSAGQTSQSLVLTGIPMAESGTGWYQIVLHRGGVEKVYNLYTSTFLPDGATLPQFSDFGTDPSLFGVDGLATLVPGAMQPTGGGLLTFSVNVTGVSPTLDLSLMQANTSSSFLDGQTTATAPVAGVLHAGAFVAVAGQTDDVHDTLGNGVDLAVTAHAGKLAFGWTGLSSAPDRTTWTETFTNLVQGSSIAVISIAHHGGHAIAPIHAKADLVGGWQGSVAQQLGNGVYDVSMTAYAAKLHAPNQPDEAVPLTKESATLTVTVALTKLALGASGDGLALSPDQSGTEGNWIHLSALGDGLPEGVAVALYATDAAGNPVGPDGSIVASVADAILGWVGSVASDDGETLLDGTQAVYLGLGQELHFAVVSARDTLDLRPVVPEAKGDGSFSIDLGGITLTAAVDNTLSAGLQAASVQRMYGLPVMHLDAGEVLEIALAGSASNINTLGFVRIDFDQAEGTATVGGVAYADSDAFRLAVRDALDAGFSAQVGGGTFRDTAEWTVAGGTGFYAPVLITQSGQIFVPGNGNAGGQEYIRIFGDNTFGFEDLTAAEDSDFDYNDVVMRLRPVLEPELV